MYLGADLAGIAIPGGEIAQIGAMLASSEGGGPMLDLVGTAMGALPPADPGERPEPGRVTQWRKPVDGADVRPADVIIGLPSSGLHSNGYSLARHALFDIGGLTLDDMAGDGRLDDALLQPTRVYVAAAEALWAAGVTPRGLVHISGGGLLNLGRLAADVSYELDALPAPPPVFGLIAQAGSIPASTMYATFNMGIGFCVVVSQDQQQAAMAALQGAGEEPVRIGQVSGQPGHNVTIPAQALTGRGDTFLAR
jgi:phosphoribosylformylglycinamidine cyclo-ligase